MSARPTMGAPRLALLAAVLPAAVAVGCVTPAPGAPGASVDPRNQPFFRPGEETPVPDGVVGTPDPFLAKYPATSQFVLPTATTPNPAPIKADYVVAAIDQVAGGTRISCLARGKALNGNPLEFRFEVLVDRPPPAPASWPVVRAATAELGKAKVTHYFGAGSGYEGFAGSVAISRVDRLADAVAYEFAVDARLEPTSAGPGTPDASPSPRPGAPTASPPATAPPAATPTPMLIPVPSPTITSTAAPHRVLLQFEQTKSVRWTGAFFVKPGAVP